MKTLIFKTKYVLFSRAAGLAFLILLTCYAKGWAQTYADTSSSGVTGLASVTSPNAATNSASLTDNTTLNSVVAGGAYLQLKFTTATIPANTIVFVKYTTALANLLGSLTVTAYSGSTSNNTAAGDGTAVATSYYTTTATDGSNYLAITSTQSFNAVRIRLSGVLGSMSIYYGLYYPLGTGCISPATTTTSVSGVSVGTFQTPAAAIDGNFATYSNVNITLAVAGSMTQSVYYNNSGSSTDAATIALSIPSTGLANLALLGAVTIQAYNGNTAVGSATSLSSLLNLALLNTVGADNPINVSVVPGAAFNRVDIVNSNVAGLLSGVRIYEVTLTPPRPQFTLPVNDTVYVCSGSSVTLTADNPATGNELRWYATNLASNTTILGTGAYTPPFSITADTVFYVATGKTGCTPSSERVPVRVRVKPLPAKPTAPDVSVCSGSSTTLSVTSPVAGNTYSWYKTATGGTSIFTGTSYTTTVLIADTTLYVQSDSTNGCSSRRDTVVVTVKPRPAKPTAPDIAICSGLSTTLTVTSPVAGNTYNWYKTATGGTSIFTGTSYTTTVLNADTTLYVQADSANGCSSRRDTVVVTVKPRPAKPTVPDAAICNGNSTTLTVTSPVAGNTYNWYKTATGGTSIFTGTSYTTTVLNADTTLYVQADSANGCSSRRDTVVVTVKPPPAKPTVPDAAICNGNSTTLTVTSPVAGNTYNWYKTATGGTSIFTGTAYTTTVLTADTTLYVQADSTNGCSGGRDTVVVTVKPLPVKPLGKDTIICSGTSVTLSVISPVAGNTYSWYKAPSGGTSIYTGTTYTTSVLTADTVLYLRADSANGCSSRRDTVTVTVNPLPSLLFTTPLNICDGVTQASIPYSNAQNAPLFYHIAWNPAAISAGFSADTTDISIVNPIPLTIPNTAPPASYSGNLIIKNAISNHQCPATYPFVLNLVALPGVSTITTFE